MGSALSNCIYAACILCLTIPKLCVRALGGLYHVILRGIARQDMVVTPDDLAHLRDVLADGGEALRLLAAVVLSHARWHAPSDFELRS